MATISSAGANPSPSASQRFDLRAEAQRLDAAQSRTWMMNYIGVGALLLFGVLFAVLGSDPEQWVYVGVGGAMIVFGAYMAVKVFRDRRRRTDWVEVDRGGIHIGLSDGSSREIGWKDPDLRVALLDWRGAKIYGMSGMNTVPCTMSAGGIYAGLSLEALKAIRQSAIDAGVPVTEPPPMAGARRTHLGTFPNEPRGFTAPGPYE